MEVLLGNIHGECNEDPDDQPIGSDDSSNLRATLIKVKGGAEGVGGHINEAGLHA